VAVIDHALRRELPQGPCWYRDNDDGYGEHADGAPFDGTGIGRLWPLMTGERAHYELAAGRPAVARALLAALEKLTSDGGLIPEQVWDSDDIVERELMLGRPSGSAMPLVWAHSEHIKLCRSLADGGVFDMPPGVAARYGGAAVSPRVQPWRPDWRPATLAAGRVLRVDLPAAGEVAWSAEGSSGTVATAELAPGLHVAELPTAALKAGARVSFRAGDVEASVEVG
jgi:glucoamylase